MAYNSKYSIPQTILTKEEIEDSGLKWLVELDLQSSKKETIGKIPYFYQFSVLSK